MCLIINELKPSVFRDCRIDMRRINHLFVAYYAMKNVYIRCIFCGE